jgi:hypothetical protein
MQTEFQLFDHGAERSRGNLALEVLHGGFAGSAHVERSVAAFAMGRNPVVGEALRSRRVPCFPQELRAFHESSIVHLCTDVNGAGGNKNR